MDESKEVQNNTYTLSLFDMYNVLCSKGKASNEMLNNLIPAKRILINLYIY